MNKALKNLNINNLAESNFKMSGYFSKTGQKYIKKATRFTMKTGG
jgi:hypothetical protein